MRLRALLPVGLAALVGAAVAVLPALAAAPSEAKLEVNENCVENDWPCWASPGSGSKPRPASRITIAAGGEVMFIDNAGTKANLAWLGSAPACSPGVPVSPASPQTSWEGKCKFEAAGSYRFESSTLFNGGPSENYTEYEIVVEGAATGNTPTTTPTTTTTTTPTTPTPPTSGSATDMTPGETGPGSPLEGGSSALKLAANQRGSTVRGSLRVSAAGSGGRLEVALLAARASLTRTRHPGDARIGGLVRSSLKAGSVSFTVPLSAKGRASLQRHRRLRVTVKITLAPLRGTAVSLTRGVVLRA